jgi:cardiolipin synthase C
MKWWRCWVALLLAAWAVGCASLPANDPHPPSQAFAAPDQTALGQFVQQRRVRDHARSDSGFALLSGVDPAYDARVSLLREAQKSIDLQYYAIHADGSTEVLLDELRHAAQRGVRVRILLDDMNTVGKDAQVLRLAFVPNIQVRLFNPSAGPRETLLGHLVMSAQDAARIAKRMHNKLFIVDNAVGITGGRNLGNAYFGNDGKSNFVDLDVLAVGRIVRDMSASFDRYWNNELAYPVQTLVKPGELDKLRAMPDGQPQPPSRPDNGKFDWRTARLIWAPSVLLQDEPGKVGPDDDEVNAGDTVIDGLLHLMDGAQKDVLIDSAYFVPGKVMMDRFKRLRERGIRVRVLANSLASNDAPAAHAGYERYRTELLKLGVELHELRAEQSAGGSGGNAGLGSGGGGSKSGAARASLHSKAVVIDGRLTVIGSMNLDLRSRSKNSEVGLVLRSAAFARAVTDQVEATIAHGAYRLELEGGHHIVWRAPAGASFKDGTNEPGASLKQRALAAAIAPFAPDEML